MQLQSSLAQGIFFWLTPQVSEKKEGNLATNTFRGLHGAFIVADIARQETFHGVAKFRQIIDDKVKNSA